MEYVLHNVNSFFNEILAQFFLINSVLTILVRSSFNLPNIDLFKVNNNNIRKRCEICQRRRSNVFIVNFEDISHLF